MTTFNILDVLKQSRTLATQKGIETNDFVDSQTEFSRTYLDAVRERAKKLENENLADKFSGNTLGHKLPDFINENLTITSILKRVGGLSNSKLLGDSVLKKICFSISENYKALVLILETALKGILILLKKIEKLAAKVKAALLQFANELRDALINLILASKYGTDNLGKESIDFAGIVDLMRYCPCIIDLVKEMFPKCKTAQTAEAVISCIQNEYLVSPALLIASINTWTANALADNIKLGFNALDKAIGSMMGTLLKPFRKLVKQYCRELNSKHNVNLLLKNKSTRCLFVYTTEYDKKGNKYFGMSILDMLNTMKQWATCIEFGCSTLNDDIKKKVQDYNEQLKLEMRFWKDETVMDIYLACISTSQENDTVRPVDIRAIYSKFKGKGIFTSIMDFHKDIGKIADPSISVAKDSLGPAATIIADNGNIQENDIEIDSGTEAFKDKVETLIIQIYKNLSVEITEDKYFRKVEELADWDFRFKKSEAYIATRKQIANKFKTSFSPVKTSSDVASEVIDNTQRTTDAESYTSSIVPPQPTYEVLTSSFPGIIVPPKPTALPLESNAELYKRWFSMAVYPE